MPLVAAIRQFGVARLRTEDQGPEPIGDGLLRVGIKAVSLNHRDVLVTRGTYGAGLTLPLIPCSDGAGVVLERGPGVTGLAPGDRVCAHMVPDWQDGPLEPRMRLTTLGGPAQGVLGEERVLPQAALVPIPPILSFEEAACLPVAGLAAWCALTSHVRVGPGQRVLVLGTGGLSTLGLQIAKTLGAEVAVVSSSDAKLERVSRLGADFTASFRERGWGHLVRRWSDGGVDVVLDIGGEATFDQSVTATRDGGTVALLGILGRGPRPLGLTDVLMRRIRVQGIFVGSRADLLRYLDFVETHALVPLIDRVFEGVSAARHAFAHLVSGRHVGKVVVRVAA
jgi:NADPH:quinone reductase-like Zn-dependent oxidoreductase